MEIASKIYLIHFQLIEKSTRKAFPFYLNIFKCE